MTTPVGQTNILAAVASRISRDTAVYSVAMGVTFPFALLSVVVFTRYLSPPEYGNLAVLLVMASMLTILYNVGTLQGVMSLVYGSTDLGDDDGGDAGVEAQPGVKQAPQGAKREALGTGMAMTTVIVFMATVPLLLAAPEIAKLLVGDAGFSSSVRWAATSAAAGSLFRLAGNVFRMERRPSAYAFVNALRPASTISIGVLLLSRGWGIDGVLAGLALGTLTTTAVAVAIGRNLYALAFVKRHARAMLRMGWPVVPVVMGVWIVQNADLVLLSHFATDSTVAGYRVANRVSAFTSYVVSAFLMASAPLERTSLLRAAYDNLGREKVRSTLLGYYAAAGAYLILVIVLAADAFVLLAAPGYRTATGLMPLMAAGFVAYGYMILLSRTAVVANRAKVFATIVVCCAIAFILLCLALIPLVGSVGAALAMPLTFAAGSAVWALQIRRSANPVALQRRRVASAVSVACGSYAIAALLGFLAPELRWFMDLVVVLVVCPVGYVVAGVVPTAHLRPLGQLAVGVIGRAADDRPRLERRVHLLDPVARARLREASRRRPMTPDDPSEATAIVASLRLLGRIDPKTTPNDADVGAHLIDRGPEVERDARAKELWAMGVDPWELHQLEELMQAARRLPNRRWRKAGSRSAERVDVTGLPSKNRADATALSSLGNAGEDR